MFSGLNRFFMSEFWIPLITLRHAKQDSQCCAAATLTRQLWNRKHLGSKSMSSALGM